MFCIFYIGFFCIKKISEKPLNIINYITLSLPGGQIILASFTLGARKEV